MFNDDMSGLDTLLEKSDNNKKVGCWYSKVDTIKINIW